MKYLLLIIPISLILFSASCKKEDPLLDYTQVSGRVLDKVTGQPIANAEIHLVEMAGLSVPASTGAPDIGYLRSDANGIYNFDFTHREGYLYYVYATTRNYIETSADIVSIEKGKVNEGLDVLLRPYGYLRIHVKNVNPFNQFDLIKVEAGFNDSGKYFNGSNIDTSFYSTEEGNRERVITTRITKNGVQSIINHSIFVYAHDTTNLTIDY